MQKIAYVELEGLLKAYISGLISINVMSELEIFANSLEHGHGIKIHYTRQPNQLVMKTSVIVSI